MRDTSIAIREKPPETSALGVAMVTEVREWNFEW